MPEIFRLTGSDTFRSDLSTTKQFNDRAYFTVDLPNSLQSVSEVNLDSITGNGTAISGKLIGFALEQDQGKLKLHIQVDIPSSGYLQGPIRQIGATLKLTVKR